MTKLISVTFLTAILFNIIVNFIDDSGYLAVYLSDVKYLGIGTIAVDSSLFLLPMAVKNAFFNMINSFGFR